MAPSDRAREDTVRRLQGMGFAEARALEAVAAVANPANLGAALEWLFEHGEEDKGGAVAMVHCPHVAALALVEPGSLAFGGSCVHGCGGSENWVCLSCGEARCGRYGAKHSLKHWEETRNEAEGTLTVAEAAEGAPVLGHCLALSFSDLHVWCYACDAYVEHEALHPFVRHMEGLKHGGSSGGAASSAAATAQPGSPMVADPVEAHGTKGKVSWPLPRLARACHAEARPGYKTRLAHEYLDEEDVLRSKVQLLADLVRRSRSCVAYTGAGISTASGIPDYATKASDSVAAGAAKASAWEAQPTLAHRVLVGLHRAGHLKHWVQQNHDGLPQKAGFPQRDINEIHGAWYDPSNPVVPMDGTLREDLLWQLADWESRADLCLALGTSMVGMNADRIALTTTRRELGTVIVSLQQTQYDRLASVRIFATIDRVMDLLAAELGVDVPPAPAAQPWPAPPVLRGLRFRPDGSRDEAGDLTLDLRPGSRLRVVHQPEWDKQQVGDLCEVVAASEDLAREGHVAVRFPRADGKGQVVRVLGRWWLDGATDGTIERLPLVPADQ